MERKPTNPQIPAIHLNGTSRESLIEPLSDAACALGEAIEKTAQTYPNARDYYVLPTGALNRAEAQHASRMERLRDVYAELKELAEGIYDAPGPRRK
jgi:hypothetical protein